MLECPSCRQALPLNARFCSFCGVRLSATANFPHPVSYNEGEQSARGQPVQSALDDISACDTVMQALPAGFFQRARQADQMLAEHEAFPHAEQEPLPANSADPYARIRRELATQCFEITASMESLLPFVYENHRAENQALFASTLADKPPLENEIWGRVAFVLGAYGNYMYRYPLDAGQKRQVWQALLWAVYYERSYRRKYLAQRCQQLLHFFQGCKNDASFLAYALDDLAALSPYLETSSLKKLQETLHQLPVPPADLLLQVDELLVVAEEKKHERQAAQAAQKRKKLTKKELAAAQNRAKKAPARKQNGSGKPVAAPPVDGVPAPAVELAPGARRLLGFFTDEQCAEFFACLRTARLEAVNRLLQETRPSLLAALRVELGAVVPRDYQAPRRPIRLGKKHADRFVEARRLLASPHAHEQQLGLRLFEQGARETTHPDYMQLAREWMLYARAVTQGSPRAAGDWESDLQRGEASWEEIWNLAFFYQQTAYPAEALRALRPGLDEMRAPVAHLLLALTCALDLLLEPDRSGAPARQSVQVLLLTHLEHWPHPLSCLAWLALAYEAHGPLHPRQQSQRLSTFQALLEHPLSLPDPQRELPELRVTALEEALVEQARCDEAWFLWIHDYAERHPRKYQAWVRLAETSERLGRLETTEQALQHLVEIQYHHDYARYQEGTPLPRAEYLRRNLEKLFEFYQRHGLSQQSAEAFQSCYPALSHLWEARDPANRRLITLTRQHLEARQRDEDEAARTRREHSLRELSKTITVPLEHFKPGQRVGIFVDYENIARFIPREMDIEGVGKALASYAARFGEVVCQWASASPQNLSNLADVRLGLEAAHFKVRFPRRELQFGPAKKNQADFALLECMSEARANERPDIYLIVSGDRDYFERVCSLLDAGHTVRIIAAAGSQHLSFKYRELEQQRARERQAAGFEEPDFFIDDLEGILYPLVSLN